MLSTFTIKHRWIFLLLVSALIVATVVLLNSVERFYTETEQLLVDNAFAEGSTHWQEKGGNTAVFDQTLEISNRPGGSHNVFQNVIIDAGGHYQLSFEAGTDAVVPEGEEVWKNANVAIIYRDKAGDRIGSRMLLNLEGTNPLEAYSEKFPLKDILGSIDVAFRLYHSGGNFTISNPVLSQLGEFSSFKYTKVMLTACWLLAMLILAHTVFSVIGIKQRLFLVFLGLIVLLGVLMPKDILTQLTQNIATILPPEILSRVRSVLVPIYGGESFVYPGAEVSKIGHVLVFCMIGFLAGYSAKYCGVIFSMLSVAVFAMATEVLQMLVDGRSTRLDDFVVDCIGALFGFALGVVWFLLVQQFSGRHDSQGQADIETSFKKLP